MFTQIVRDATASISSDHLMIFIVFYIISLDQFLPISNFTARKLCHSGCGFCIMLLDPKATKDKLFVWLVASSSIMMSWNVLPFLPSFRFSRSRDVGITAFLSLVSLWFWLELDPTILSPMFFADPAGAVFGKYFTKIGFNAKWYGDKTVAGTAAVFIFCFLSLLYEVSVFNRLFISAAAALVEAVGGDYDNIGIAGVVLIGWLLTAKKN